MAFTSFPIRPKYSQLVNLANTSDSDDGNPTSTGLYDDSDSDDASYQFSSSHAIIPPVDIRRQLFPYSIVWGPLPLITWCFPCIGHLGIADSNGYVHDFHGPYTVRQHEFMVGNVYMYYQFDHETLLQYYNPDADYLNLVDTERGPEQVKAGGRRLPNSHSQKTPESSSETTIIPYKEHWDQSIAASDLHYSGTVHNIVNNNCHHHVASAMSRFGHQMTMFQAWLLITIKGRYVSCGACFMTYLPCLIIWTIMFVVFGGITWLGLKS